MSAYDIAPGVPAALERFVLPDKLGFGAVNAPVMFSAEWRDGQWQRGTLLPYGPIEVWPGSRALQYAELIFEGLKAYKVGQPRPNLFRAADTAAAWSAPLSVYPCRSCQRHSSSRASRPSSAPAPPSFPAAPATPCTCDRSSTGPRAVTCCAIRTASASW